MRDAWKRQKIDNIALMLNAAIAAQGRVGLMLNVATELMDQGHGGASCAELRPRSRG